MPQDKQFSGLFDIAGDMGKKKKEPTSQSLREKAKELPAKKLSDEELKEQFEQCKKHYEEIKNAIESAFEKSNISPRQFKEYISDPSHFDDVTWQGILKKKKEVAEKLEELMPEKKKKEEPKTKATKKGFSGKQRWIPMG